MHSTQFCIDRRTHATKSNEKLENSLVNNMYARAARVFTKKKENITAHWTDGRMENVWNEVQYQRTANFCESHYSVVYYASKRLSEWASEWVYAFIQYSRIGKHYPHLDTFSFSNGLQFHRFSPAQNYSQPFWFDVGAKISKSWPDAHIWCVHVSSFYFLHIYFGCIFYV